MAEINIERKTTNVWTWLIPVLLAAAALWWFFGRGTGGTFASGETADSAGAYNQTPMTSSDSAKAGASGFAAFVSEKSAVRDEMQQHTFTAGGIRRLAAALDGMQPGEGTSTKLAEMRDQANALENSASGSDQHADMTRTAFLAAADVFSGLPADRLGTDAVSEVRAKAEAMKSAPTLLAQKDQIDAFFAAASRALRGAKS